MRTPAETIAETARLTARDRALIAARDGRASYYPGDQLQALLDVVSTLAAAQIPYALIGGIAVNIHTATPRATNDIDIAVLTTIPTDGVVEALRASRITHTGSYEHSTNFVHANDEPIQIASHPLFDAMILRAEPVEIAGITINVVRKDDLIAMKEQAAGDPARRPSKASQDRTDVLRLREGPQPEEGW